MPGYLVSKPLASSLYELPASDVYQTTLPSAFAPSRQTLLAIASGVSCQLGERERLLVLRPGAFDGIERLAKPLGRTIWFVRIYCSIVLLDPCAAFFPAVFRARDQVGSRSIEPVNTELQVGQRCQVILPQIVYLTEPRLLL